MASPAVATQILVGDMGNIKCLRGSGGFVGNRFLGGNDEEAIAMTMEWGLDERIFCFPRCGGSSI